MEAPLAMRRSALAVFVAFLFTVLTVLAPWWRIAYTSEAVSYSESWRLFVDAGARSHHPAVIATGLLVIAAGLLLLLRWAARSHVHEPQVWRRDLKIALALQVAALLSVMLWPEDLPHFWGGRTFLIGGDVEMTESAKPAGGFWSLVASVAALGVAMWMGRAKTDK